MDSGYIKTNSVKYYGGWGDNVPSVSQTALASHAAAVAEIKKLLRKKSLKTREQFMARLKKSYSMISQSLLDEPEVGQSLKDGYLRKWQHDLDVS